jgi:hypothetical protein
MKRAGGRAGHGSRYSRGGPETAVTRQQRRKVAAAAAFKFAARPGPGPRPPASLSASHGEGARRANSEAGGPGARCPFLPRRGCTRQHSCTMTYRPESPDVPRAMIVNTVLFLRPNSVTTTPNSPHKSVMKRSFRILVCGLYSARGCDHVTIVTDATDASM